MVASAETTANPLLEGLRLKRTPEPCIITIFGASGDLTARKLFPALYSLAFRRLLPEHFAVVGSARSEMTDDAFREAMRRAVEEHGRDPVHDDVWDWLAERTSWVPTEFSENAGEDRIGTHLEQVDEQWQTQGNRVYYLAVPPRCDADARRRAREAAYDDGLDAADHREAVRPRPHLGPRAERACSPSTSRRARSSASTTTSARRRSRT